MKEILFAVTGVVVFTTFMFGVLVFSMRGAHARVRFEKIKRELKEQGRYKEWARANRVLLLAKAIANSGAWSGLPTFLAFTWLDYRQIGIFFLGIFILCLMALVPINWVLYDKIYQDQK
jgi:hypothetical protein